MKRISCFFHTRHAFVLLVALWGLTLVGIQSIPIETHEAFVLATAQEMKTSGDWILPRFNNEPRLKKPPLNYWATLLVSAVDPVNSDVQIYHGRIVSLLAALMMVLLTAKTGEKLYGKEAGLLAALFLMCTSGLLNYSHNAKPDVLYAAFCTLQLFAWMGAWKAEDASPRQKRDALLGWAAAGLATLTKGPQVPAVFLLGLLAFLVAGQDRRRVLNILRPLGGTFVFCLLVLPWWILLQHRLQALGVDIADSQLSGSLLRTIVGWKELLSLFYLWGPVVEMLPVSLLLVIVIPLLIKNRAAMQMRPSIKLLVYVSITMLVLFTFVGQYRKHYILPLLPVFSLFIADSLQFIRFRGINKHGICCFCAAGFAGAVICAGFMILDKAYGVLLLFSALSLATAFILKQELSSDFRESSAFIKQLVMITSALILLGAGYHAYQPGTKWRTAEQEFKKQTGELISSNDRLVCWKTSVNVLPYFVKQSVCAFTDQENLTRYLVANQNRHPVFAIIPATELQSFSGLFENQVLRTATNKKEKKKSLCLVKIQDIRGLPPSSPPH